MRAKNIYILAIMSCLTACSEMVTEEKDPGVPEQPVLQNVVFLAETTIGQTISVFREGNSGFAFLKTIPVTGKRTEAQLPLGKYQFLFAGSYGNNTRMNPPSPGTTLFPEMRFTVSPDANTGYIREGDELYLSARNADAIHTITGPSLIRDTLERAVAQVIVHVGRGFPDGQGGYTPLPYQNDSIVRYFSHIRLDIENAGIAVNAQAIPEGEGRLSADFPANAPDSITPDGFAVYTGPFFFPAANEAGIDLTLNLYRRSDSPQPDLRLFKQATVKRNQQLLLYAWVTSDWNIIGITADIRPISQETAGEKDIWDDHITL